MAVIGIDLGGTKIAGAVFEDQGKLIQKELLKIGEKTGRQVANLIITQIHQLRDNINQRDLSVGAIGISVPGIYFSDSGRVWAPNIHGWENYPLLKELNVQFPRIPIKIDSDRACYILGETWQGTAQGCRDAIFVAVGTGIGAGILIKGQILRGHNDIAGATGWMALKQPFRKEYLSCGCFEYHASGAGLVKVARDLIEKEKNYRGILRHKASEKLTTPLIFKAYEESDPIAKTVIEQAVRYWGMAAANYVSLFNPDKIIFGGGVFGPAARFLDDIRSEATRWAQPIAFKKVSLEVSALGSAAGLIGAGRLALLA